MKSLYTVAILLTNLLFSLLLLEAGATENQPECSCHLFFLGGNKLDCTGRYLKDIPNDVACSDVTYLSLASNNITEIQDNSFLGYPSVKRLNLADNQIDTISFGAFRLLENLKVINLQGNRIYEMVYVDLPLSMETLFLSFNPLSFSLSSPLPLGSGDVQTLALNNIGLETLDLKVLSGLSHVTELQAGGNKINSIDFKNFVGLRYLKKLYLNLNEIEEIIPAPDGTVLRITHLYLESNKLTHLESSSFKNLASLHNLHLGHNNLVIPSELSSPFLSHPTLEFLDLSFTNIREITGETFDLPSLWGFRLEGCGIYSLDSAFENMPNLKGVSLVYNDIINLQAGMFAENVNLSELLLDENPLMNMDFEELQSAMSGGSESELGIENTPLACSCAFQKLSDWAKEANVYLNPLCILRECVVTFGNAIQNQSATMPDPQTSPLKAAIRGLENSLTSPQDFFEEQVQSQ